MKKIAFILSVIILSSFVTGEKITLMSGSIAFLNEAKSVYVEFDYSKTSIDGLSTEEGFIDYRIKKEKESKNGKSAEDVKADWAKDKKYIANMYIETAKKSWKDHPFAINNDNPKSDYKLTIQYSHIATGNPISASSVKYKMIFTETATGNKAAEVAVPTTYGEQLGPLYPTVGLRVSMANYNSIAAFNKFLKKTFKI